MTIDRDVLWGSARAILTPWVTSPLELPSPLLITTYTNFVVFFAGKRGGYTFNLNVDCIRSNAVVVYMVTRNTSIYIIP